MMGTKAGISLKIIAKPEVFCKSRIMCGFSQRELARRSGISHAYISLLERSRKPVGPGTAKRLSEILGVSMEELFLIE